MSSSLTKRITSKGSPFPLQLTTFNSTAEDATSFELSVFDLDGVAQACSISPQLQAGEDSKKEEASDRLSSDQVNRLSDEIMPQIERLVSAIFELPLRPGPTNPQQKCHWMSVEELYRLLEIVFKFSGHDDGIHLMEHLQALGQALESAALASTATNSGSDFIIDSPLYLSVAGKVQKLVDALAILFKSNIKEASNQFRVVVLECEEVINDGGSAASSRGNGGIKRPSIVTSIDASQKPRKLCLWSFAAHIAVRDMVHQGVHSVIVTSGTLKPLASVAAQLGGPSIEFPLTLENNHVITDDQLFTAVVSVGPSGNPIQLTYDAINKDNMLLQDVGNVVRDVCELVGHEGILAFFPSYSQMHKCIERWQNCGLWWSIMKAKSVFVEPSDAQMAADNIDEFCAVVKDKSSGGRDQHRKTQNKPPLHQVKKRRSIGRQWPIQSEHSHGAIFFGVHRGRLSEGLSLSDDLVRVIIVIGVPYPSITDLRVFLKRQILDRTVPKLSRNVNNKAAGCTMDGRAWYNQQASRAVNQAAGRVIRHKDDFGAILFVDCRYSSKERQRELSGWVGGNFKIRNLCLLSTTWQQISVELQTFLLSKKNIPKSTPSAAIGPIEQQPTIKDTNEMNTEMINTNTEVVCKENSNSNNNRLPKVLPVGGSGGSNKTGQRSILPPSILNMLKKAGSHSDKPPPSLRSSNKKSAPLSSTVVDGLSGGNSRRFKLISSWITPSSSSSQNSEALNEVDDKSE